MSFLSWLKSLIFGAPRATPGQSPFATGMGPVRLVVLRHAEKTGDRRDPHLSAAGSKRAQALVGYLPATFGAPDFLIAARTSDRSRRPVETLEPLAVATNLAINEKFDDEEVDELVALLGEKKRYRGKSGIVSWRHSDIPRLVAALGAPAGTLPGDWDADDYTTLVDITYGGDGSVTARRLRMPF